MTERQQGERTAKEGEEQGDRRQVHKLSGDEKTTKEQLNNATSPHSSILYRPLLPTGCSERFHHIVTDRSIIYRTESNLKLNLLK